MRMVSAVKNEADRRIGGKTMAEHLRFAVAYGHCFCGAGHDPFGPGTRAYPWDQGATPLARAQAKADAAFEFVTKLGVPYWCFHDIDLAPDAEDIGQYQKNLKHMTGLAKARQDATGIKLLWGTANLFSHPRYMNGASTNPDFAVVARAAVQVKAALEATVELGGEHYVFWGGREGYASLVNTDMKRELDHLAALLHLAVDHAKKIGFKGQFLIEPKPREPSTHQYDSDAAACLNFLREYGLLKHFKLNLETNHATLAGHTMEHEMEVSIGANALGSVDANRGDTLVGWDTDQFPTDLYLTTNIMLRILKMGGFTKGGLNFDAKRRRESHEPVDLFHAHIGGMDAFARGLKIAHAIIKDGKMDKFVSNRYASWDSGIGKKVESGKATLAQLDAYAQGIKAPTLASGRQEMLENLINEYIR